MHLEVSHSEETRHHGSDKSQFVFSTPTEDARSMSTTREPIKGIKILVVDRDSMSSQLLANALGGNKLFRAFAMDSSQLMQAMTARDTDLVIIGADLAHDVGSGFDLSNAVSCAHPNVRILILLNESTSDSVIRAFRSGAYGVVSRAQLMDDLLDCIDQMQKGFIGVAGKQAGYLLEAIRSLPAPELPDSNALLSLSDRELQVVRQATTGKTNKMIANELHLSEHTVKNYLFRAFEKLGVSSRVELLFCLTQNGRNFGAFAKGRLERESA